MGKKFKTLFKIFFLIDSQSNSYIGKNSSLKLDNVGSNPTFPTIALVVQWIRTLDYGSSNKRSNRFESTNKALWPSGSGEALQKLLRQFDSGKCLVVYSEM